MGSQRQQLLGRRQNTHQGRAMSNQKFDLTNVGGQPKDWMQREHEKSLEPGLGFKGWMQILLLIASVVFTLGALAWGFFRVFLS